MDYSYLRALERKPDPRDYLLGAIQAPISIPASFLPDNAWLVPNFQGKTYFCGEHAGTHLKAVLDCAISNGATKGRKTPRYGAIKLKDPKSPVCDGYGIDAGTDMRSIFKWLQTFGADDYEPLENDVTLPHAQYCDPSAVTPDMDATAAQSKIASYAFGSTDYESLCQYVFQNKAVLLLIRCDDGFFGTPNPTFTTRKYGHFIVGDGYDEAAGFLRIIDSADKDFPIKRIAKQYITPEFIIESGTAVDIPASVKQVLASATIPPETKPQLIQAILNDIAQVLALMRQEIGQM
jgi:hypothetical protein